MNPNELEEVLDTPQETGAPKDLSAAESPGTEPEIKQGGWCW